MIKNDKRWNLYRYRDIISTIGCMKLSKYAMEKKRNKPIIDCRRRQWNGYHRKENQNIKEK